MYARVILHNMIVEDERDSYEVRFDYDYDQGTFNNEVDNLNHGPIHEFARVLEIGSAIRDRATCWLLNSRSKPPRNYAP